ncbi:inositol monophosphatase family protein [Corynebacterium lipophiloflavum]|nr:inositol monophosphatase family protein [Corynebacterium lipophiloflavum]
MSSDPAALREICGALARQAGELVATQRAQLATEGSLRPAETKSSEVDPVTVVDTACERFIAEQLANRRPGDGILGEEGSSTESETGVEWIVDPIDGTVNFLYGIPVYAVSIGVAVGGELAAGAVFNPETGELFSAAAGRGATLQRDGEAFALRASDETSLARSLVATGFSYSAAWREQQARFLTSVLPKVRDIRRGGSAALDLCNVAAGRVDAYYEHGTHPWDYAAGAIIATEAGARVSHPGLGATGYDGALTVAAAPGVWGHVRELLDNVGASAPLTSP